MESTTTKDQQQPPPAEELWSSILDSVSSSRSIPSKQILVLGLPGSGKTTISKALLRKDPSQDDFALGYDFADVRDDADEDTLARLSVYTIPSDSPSYSSLIPNFLNPRTCLPHTLVTIVLDWTKPWTFVEQLETWLKWIETWAKGDASREVDIAREESRERLQSHLQHYTEPSSDPLPTGSSSLQSTLLPLGPGTLTDNAAGVSIIVVCTKADLIDEQPVQGGPSGMSGMVKGKGGEWEERTDGIMQILRTICLKYGAALFYTTQAPDVLDVLRQYALHLLFVPPAPGPGGAESSAPPRNPFPFSHKPNALDRDRVVIPVGWDSYGKIGVLREGFDAKAWGEAWDADLEVVPGQPDDKDGAKSLYSAMVPDEGAKPPPLPPFNNPTPEQTFLAKHYDENAKKPDRDPRGAFRNPTDLAGAAAGIVGPMESSSFSMPNVERALSEMEIGIGGLSSGSTDPSVAARRLAARTAGASGTSRPAVLNPLNQSIGVGATSPTGRGAVSPGLPNAGSPPGAGGQSQHDVLQNFFQSLLSSKDRAGGATRPGSGLGSNRPTSTGTGTNGLGASTSSHPGSEDGGT